jgi:hypothetical protein
MRLLESKPRHYRKNDIRLLQMLLHKFMPIPVHDFQEEAVTNLHTDVVSAHELDDLVPWDHLLMQGGAGCYPPWLEVDDLVLYQRQGRNGIRRARLLLGVVRSVTLPKHMCLEGNGDEHWENMEGDPYVGIVDISRLKPIEQSSGRYKVSQRRQQFSWRSIVSHVKDVGQITCFLNSGQHPVEWEGVHLW